ncbi:hypothetical protein GCM10009530_74530 [Microbispora corallina]|uniref:Uncharacterized protein n=1 Tax=Microbispora corallina TaxID=83302 RepID=A0ABQ4GB99_9ACTN|nr:hypothetical protein [Microbispora corallina]GIH44312.1 hypothetical protein Mco01_73120 [Microbispora corallina]
MRGKRLFTVFGATLFVAFAPCSFGVSSASAQPSLAAAPSSCQGSPTLGLSAGNPGDKCSYRCTNHRRFRCCKRTGCKRVSGKC